MILTDDPHSLNNPTQPSLNLMRYTFYKYHGTGNDFILLDNRDGHADHLTRSTIAAWCHRRFGVGADGLMLLGLKDGYDFTMAYFNADGAPGSMCGNGARCIVRFAADIGIIRDRYHFLAPDGDHDAELLQDGGVRLWMADVDGAEEVDSDVVMNTGSPHYVKFVDGLDQLDVEKTGRSIRNSERFRIDGINVNFVEPRRADCIFVRTFERGVEAETYSCGTGVTASALVSVNQRPGRYHIEVDTLGGSLVVEFECTGPASYRNIRLMGPATFVFKGEIEA
jgi:diaminopimelate epimerase